MLAIFQKFIYIKTEFFGLTKPASYDNLPYIVNMPFTFLNNENKIN